MNYPTFVTLIATCAVLLSSPALADSGHAGDLARGDAHTASSHAPIGVMGDHGHRRGEWMISWRAMRMNMEGNRDDDNGLSAAEIATSIPNPFFGAPMQPPTLRVVPQRMTTDMHMFGAMYGLSDRVTLLAMVPHVVRDMDHLTFAGPAGTDVLGNFTTRSEGLGDITFGALITSANRPGLLWNASISLPTGSIDERGTILTPANGRPNVRLPYAMQLGSGTVDLKPGLTYRARRESVSWGAQAQASIRLGENAEGYRLGNRADVTGWVAYDWTPALSTSIRARLVHQGSIRGRDEQIVGPVQTADPSHYGGESAALALGANYRFTEGSLAGNRLAFEVQLPAYRNLNGPQLETDWTLTAGWQYAF